MVSDKVAGQLLNIWQEFRSSSFSIVCFIWILLELSMFNPWKTYSERVYSAHPILNIFWYWIVMGMRLVNKIRSSMRKIFRYIWFFFWGHKLRLYHQRVLTSPERWRMLFPNLALISQFVTLRNWVITLWEIEITFSHVLLLCLHGRNRFPMLFYIICTSAADHFIAC